MYCDIDTPDINEIIYNQKQVLMKYIRVNISTLLISHISVLGNNKNGWQAIVGYK